MPELSVAPAAPATPIVAAGVASTLASPAKDAAGAPDGAGVTSFLNQLDSALSALMAGATSLIAPTPTAVTPLVVEASSPEAVVDGSVADDEDEEIPELLAALGLVALPVALPIVTPNVTPPTMTATMSDALASGPLTLQGLDAPTTLAAQLAPEAQQDVPTAAADAPAASDTVAIATAPSSAPAPVVSQPVGTLEQAPASSTIDSSAPGSPAESNSNTLQAPVTQTSANQAGFNQQASEGGEPDAEASEGVGETASVAMPMVASSAAPGASPIVSDVRPTEVVQQIAQQVDLYRLPGGRGVRIQLNPEGLGGVEVTVRYAPSGVVELHMNVENAATADLVQAGWGDLRNALTLHGITPDRLVMSVTSTASSGVSDPLGGGSIRSDTQTSFGQPGQQRDQHPDTRPNRSWSASLDSAPDTVEAAAFAASSRIDYRA